MSLPARQQRVLDQIEETIQTRDPRLKSLFAIFVRLTSTEAMPRIEELSPRAARLQLVRLRLARLRSVLVRPVMFLPLVAIALVSLLLAGTFGSGARCIAAPIAGGRALRNQPGGRLPAALSRRAQKP